MMTALAQPPVTTDDANDPMRLLPISVNLLPDEIVEARAGRAARRLAVGALAVAVLGTGAWYYTAAQDASDASDELASVQAQTQRDASQSRAFTELTKTRGEITALEGQLKAASAGDVAWYRVLPALRAIAPQGVQLTSISGTANFPGSTPGATPGTAPVATVEPYGSLVLNGNAPSKPSISTFAARIGQVPGLTGAFVSSVSEVEGEKTKTLQFTIQVSVEGKALNNRYTKAGK